ncbi:TonB-dependent receptor family protein [Halofilum ochraceum]|uniref:TonB-dependent receptor family protein n=1 Tax=Halofilum ochraceum TaxID=1611323 RepID=UPI0009F6CF7E|nr:TonB-dependent receptor [Halofilum ochraceum]
METGPIPAHAHFDTNAPARRIRVLLFAAAATLVSAAPAEDGVMEPIVITAPRMERNLLDVPAAVDAVDRDEIRNGRRGLTLDESLQQIPGLYFQNQYNFAQGLRISTRGFGARAPFGIRGIRLRVDGFPETLPDGQSQTDAIDLESADRIEVIRGPAAVAYGNAAGGVIDITTADGRDMAYSPAVSAQGGSHGYRKGGVRAGGNDGPWAYHINASALRFDGFREQSRVERDRVNAKVTRSFDEERELQTVLTLMDNPVSEDPGGLTAAELADDRSAATANARALDAGQTASQQRLGLRWRDGGAAGGVLTLRGFYTRRDFEQQLPFPGNSLLGYDRDFFGLGTEYARSGAFAGMPVQYTIGGEIDRQIDDRFRFAVDGDGAIQSRTARERQQATAGGLFAQADLGVTEALDLSAGLRFDRVRFEIDDELVSDGDDSGSRRFDETSGSLGALYALSTNHRLYANVSTAFETPTFTEFADPDGTGGFNPAIESQQALNREIGARGRFGSRLRYQLALFRVDVDDEIVSFERNGRDFYENAAETRRDGIELGLDWIASRRLSIAAAWTWSDYRFEEFVDRDGNDFTGNRLPGLPEHKLFLEADWRAADGRYARASIRYIDSVYADNANRVRVDDYTTLDLRAGRTWSASGRRVEAWFGIDNVTDTEHVANVRVNATGGSYFEPAPGRTFVAGLEVGF